MRILYILGQKPGMTGSGVLMKELWKCGETFGDEQRVILAAYPDDDYTEFFNGYYSSITYSHSDLEGELPFPILGMSDVMPYPSLQYGHADPSQIEMHIRAFQDRMENVMSDFNPDIVHIHHLWVLIALAKYCHNILCFVTVHGTELKQLITAPQYYQIVKDGIEHIDRFLCVSRDILNDTIRAYKFPLHKAICIGNGYNENIFQPEGSIAEIEGNVVVCAGKYVYWKGFHYLIRACGRLSIPHRLVILGTGSEKTRQMLVQEAIANNMQDKVILTGHVSQYEVAKWFRRADVFVLPSIYEPFGLVLLEAMACGCPVIASALGGPKDIISNDLVVDGLATFIHRLDENDQSDEDRYVSDIHLALAKHLSHDISPQSRLRISNSVKGLEWNKVYQLIRAEYVKALSVRNS